MITERPVSGWPCSHDDRNDNSQGLVGLATCHHPIRLQHGLQDKAEERRMIRLSIVSTLYRSEPHLEQFHCRVVAVAKQITPDFELVLVDDGSPDESVRVARGLIARDNRVRLVRLSRNFGHYHAIMTGLSHARGELIFLIDSDLEEAQEAPS